MNHSIANQFLTVTISDIGAELQSIKTNGLRSLEYLWQGDPAYWTGRAYNLFPFVGRLTDGKYTMDGKEYSLGCHGFARHSCFEVIHNTDDSIVFELSDNESTLAQYPRKFSFRVCYQVAENVLHISYEVENRDELPLVFGLGGHPGFRVPLCEGLSFEDYHIAFSENAKDANIVYLTDACFPSGELFPYPLQNNHIIPLKHDLFTRDAIVLTNVPREVIICTDKNPHYVKCSFPEMPYVGFWHKPKSDAPYVCIEPWCTLPAQQDQKMVFDCNSPLLQVEKGKTYQNHWSIEIG